MLVFRGYNCRDTRSGIVPFSLLMTRAVTRCSVTRREENTNICAAGKGAVADHRAPLGTADAASTISCWSELLADLREPVLTATADGRIVGCNAAASHLFGARARLEGRSIQDILPFVGVSSAADGHATWEGRLGAAGPRTFDVRVTRRRLRGLPTPDLDVYVVHGDPQDGAANRSRERVLTGVAHELRGPLSVLENSLDILASERDTLSACDIDRMVRSARRSVVVLRDLMDDLLTAGSLQAGEFRVHPQVVALSAIVEDALMAIEPLVAMREQRIESDLARDVCHVLADRRFVRRVMAHLLRNASQYSPAGEHIRVRAERADDQVRVTVDDRGPGIPVEQRAGLFERFYRVRPGYEEPGIGLGLAIAKGIIEAHGGSIGVETRVNVGTSVWFTLPEARGPGL